MEKTKEEAALLLERWKEFHPASFETMVNKIATALNNRDVELERVRGLLQRYGRHEEGCEYREALCSQPTCGEMHVTPCTCGLGAESADIGKLDAADESGKVKRVEEKDICSLYFGEKNDPHICGLPSQHDGQHACKSELHNGSICNNVCELDSLAGSAETGGEKTSDKKEKM